MASSKLTDTRVLWPALLGPAVAWGVHLTGAFALSAWSTEQGNMAPVHVLSALCLLGSLGGGFLAYRAWRTVGGWPMGAEAPDTSRVRYMSVLGMMAGMLFACVIVAQWVAAVVLPVRWGAG